MFKIGDGSGDGSSYGAGVLAIVVGAIRKLLNPIH